MVICILLYFIPVIPLLLGALIVVKVGVLLFTPTLTFMQQFPFSTQAFCIGSICQTESLDIA